MNDKIQFLAVGSLVGLVVGVVVGWLLSDERRRRIEAAEMEDYNNDPEVIAMRREGALLRQMADVLHPKGASF